MIIGFGYSAQVGKSTACDFLAKFYGFTSLAFADPLKQAAKTIYGLSEEQVNGKLKNEIDLFWQETPRQILQKVGTNGIRNGHRQDVWVKALERKLRQDLDNNWAISDVRFPDEAEMIKSMNGYVVKISGTFPEKQIIVSSNHESEIALDSYNNWDYIIENDRSLKDFYNKIEILYGDILQKCLKQK